MAYVLAGALAASDNGKTVGAVRERFLREERLDPLLSPGRLMNTMEQTVK